MNKTVPILLLTGYLGSGKTTLVNYILSNREGIKFAVIVNDIGEVNIDASLIQKGGIVDTKDDSLVALQNGCICCSLKMDLVKQIDDIIKLDRFDYIVIEASGICEPVPIAQTICTIEQQSIKALGYAPCRLDCVAAVVDALRLQSEFKSGEELVAHKDAEEDLENLVVQQIEFCNLLILNKVSEVKPEELQRIKEIVHSLNPQTEIIECDYARVDLSKLINSRRFDFAGTATSASWVRELERPLTEEEKQHAETITEHHHHHDHGHDDHDHDDHHEHHHHHHHHDHDHDHGEEYGISTFVYYSRLPFDLDKFDNFVATKWERNIIRAKGICYFKQNPDMSYLFEQAGVQKKIVEAGQWLCTAPEDELHEMIRQDPSILQDWDNKYGDRMQKIVFIGQRIDREKITAELDACLVPFEPDKNAGRP